MDPYSTWTLLQPGLWTVSAREVRKEHEWQLSYKSTHGSIPAEVQGNSCPSILSKYVPIAFVGEQNYHF
jgi:hypothetical protein